MELQPEEKKELENLVASYVQAIDQDEPVLQDLFADACASLISIATLFDGRENIQKEFLQNRIRKAYQTIDLIPETIDIRLLNENTALILFAYHTECITADTQQPYGIEGLETQVAIKENGVWKLAHVHYSRK